MKSSVNNLTQILLVLKIGVISSFLLPSQQIMLAQSSPSFNCFRKTSYEYITRLHLPSGEKYIVIDWGRRDNINSKCTKAANKLQKFFNSGRLNYIVEAKVNDELTIICGLAVKGEQCNNKSKIFDLLPGDTLSMFIKRLGGSTPSDERVDDEVIIDFQKVLKALTIRDN